MTAQEKNDRDDRRVAKMVLTWEAVAAHIKAACDAAKAPLFDDVHPVLFFSTPEGLSITWRSEHFPPIAEGGEIPHIAHVQEEHLRQWRKAAGIKEGGGMHHVPLSASRAAVVRTRRWVRRLGTPERFQVIEERPVDVCDNEQEAWRWPDWLSAGWIFMHPNGDWYATKTMPVLNVCGTYLICPSVPWKLGEMSTFTPPPCDHWKDSIYRNPYL